MNHPAKNTSFNISFRKKRISISQIGRLRFWIGFTAGLFSSSAISLTFNNFRETFRYVNTVSSDLLVLKPSELLFYNYFFAALSTALGLSVSVSIWMSNRNHFRGRDRLKKQVAITHSWVIFWIVMLIVARIGTLIPFILFGSLWYDNCIQLLNEYWLIFVLIPLVVFFQNWFTVRMVYRAGRWILLSFIFCIFLTLMLRFTTSVDQDKINRIYFQQYKDDYQYIDEQIIKAKNKYNIDFKPETIESLKKYHYLSSSEQMVKVKSAFSSHLKVTMDTIIMQKIIIKNFKQDFKANQSRFSPDNWDYAMPEDVIRQMEYFSAGANEIGELMEVLKEQIDLVNTLEIKHEDYKSHTLREINKFRRVMLTTPPAVYIQLEQVKKQLLKDPRYSELAKHLPEINPRKTPEPNPYY
jgi:hypothetical protein